MSEAISLMGAPGSPYTRKMLAVLRYRRIPYRFLAAGSAQAEALPKPRVALMPTFYFPSAAGGLEAVTDSTPIIRRLEGLYAGRSLIPTDPAGAFVDALVEDYADEWLTKPMFHYRWTYPADIAKAAKVLPAWRNPTMDEATLARAAQFVGERQIGRLGVVGSNPVTGPVIEDSYRRFLAAFEAHLAAHRFVLGGRPSACDFAIFGQLTQLAAFDPTPMAIAAELAPRTIAWVGLVEDLSGFEDAGDDTLDLAAPPASLRALLGEIGRLYAPVMIANARAVASGASEATCQVAGTAWSQAPFPYQAKCVASLRAAREALTPGDRETVDHLLAGTGCEALFAPARP
ncbi:MAG TPA: glutathione S-transferase family protein [Caulobacteraceae bacterium]|jgi:glutathione S-transferase|nr:glutathione S-transferase family protein [Caulobacteraceae bacterium]